MQFAFCDRPINSVFSPMSKRFIPPSRPSETGDRPGAGEAVHIQTLLRKIPAHDNSPSVGLSGHRDAHKSKVGEVWEMERSPSMADPSGLMTQKFGSSTCDDTHQ